jgi:endonuclease/exonuclease/phosphatase family protein
VSARRVLASLAVGCLFALAGWSPLAMGTATAGIADTTVVRVLNLNIFYGGDELDLHTGSWCHRSAGCPETLERVIHVIDLSGADIVGIEEGEHNAAVIADALGWYASDRTQVISRFPIVDPPGADGIYVWIEVLPGRFVAIGNVHLPSDPYGPYEIRDGASLSETLELEESVRLPAIQSQLAALPPLAADGFPTFLTGDFNSPSHYDWTAAVSAVRPEVPYPVDWPVSHALADAGFRDSYREVHPNPLAVPGFTWTPGGPEGDPQEVHDRIDWVLASGPAVALQSTVVGEADGQDVGIGFDPWPTDHRGVLSTFRVTPAIPDPFVAPSARRVFVGDKLEVTYRAAGGTGQSLAIVPAGRGPAATIKSKSVGPPESRDGTKSFGTSSIEPGDYDVILVSGGSVLSRAPFWLYKPGTETKVWTSKQTYVVGEPITVRWRAAPGFRWDWLGMYSPGDTGTSPHSAGCNAGCANNGRYLLYVYTGTQIEGTATFDASAFTGTYTWPLKPGSYEIRFLVDDSYRSIAVSANFKVVKR